MMNPRQSPHRRREIAIFWAGLIFVFLLALLPRMIYSVSRPMQWYDRSVRFWDALLAGDLEGTYQQYHPGVTTMWIAGLGIRACTAMHSEPGDESLDPTSAIVSTEARCMETGVIALGLVIAICVGLAYVLLVRLMNWPTAFSAGCFLALDPFYIAHSKVLHLDALLASFMLISALSLICYLKEKKRPDLIFSGVFAGLAFLTKSPSGFLLPYTLLATSFSPFSLRVDKRHTVKDSSTHRRGREIWSVVYTLGTWGGVACLVFSLLWPAMWSIPVAVLSELVQNALFRVKMPHEGNFFAGQVIDGDPGPLYYVATLAWKTTLVTLPANCVAILFLLRQRKHGEGNLPVWWILAYAGGFFLMMALAAKKGERYILPVLPALDVLAAWGLVQIARAIGQWDRLKLTWVPASIIAIALVVQAGTVLRHHPYYSTHHNLLLGGSRVAQHVLPLGDQGEGLDLAARFLNGYPGAQSLTAGLQERGARLFRSNFVGYTRAIEQPDVDFWVFAINSNQRTLDIDLWGELWKTCQQTEPLWAASFDGVPYVWVYPAYPHDPEAFPIEHRLDVQLGDQVRLLGYRLNSNHLSPGDTLAVTLFWQSDGRVTADYHVFVHLLDAEGLLVAQHDGVPVLGERPTWTWRDTEVLQDEHRLVLGVDLPDGTYAPCVGMYDLPTGDRLPAASHIGESMPEDRILLTHVQVSLP